MTMDRPMTMDRIEAARLGDVPHGFFGRWGGVSTGLFAGLNAGLGSSDDPDAVRENRRRAAEAVLPGARLVTVHQVHSATAVIAGDWPDSDRPHADALVTDRPGILIGIVTADCAPVLLADPHAGVVGAAHAGWRGALGGVLAATVAGMERLGARADRIAAAVGPTIAQASYEVDEAFRDRFLAVDPAHERFFKDGRPGHAAFDLEGFNLAALQAAGVGRIEALGLDTYADAGRFYSYRRSTHRGEADYGRQISLIGVG